jgi:hypothetical protein
MSVVRFGWSVEMMSTAKSTGPSWRSVNWLKMMVVGLQVAYGADDEIQVTKKAAN